MCVKLAKQKRWKSVRNYLEHKKGIQVNFSDKYSNYYACYVYTTKEDKEYILSEGHPVLTNAPRTSSATDTRQQGSNRNHRHSFDALDLSEVIIKEYNRTKRELLRLAQIPQAPSIHNQTLHVRQYLTR